MNKTLEAALLVMFCMIMGVSVSFFWGALWIALRALYDALGFVSASILVGAAIGGVLAMAMVGEVGDE